MAGLPEGQRRRMLGLIHLAQKQLSLDDEEYRDLLEALTGKRSAADLDVTGLNAVVDEMTRRGFKVTPSKPGKKLSPQTRGKAEKTPLDLLRALWIEAANQGVVRNRYESGLAAYCKRMCGVDRLEWLTDAQCSKAIEGVKKMIQRKEKTSD